MAHRQRFIETVQYISITGAQCTAISLNCIPIDQRRRKYLWFHIMFIFYWCFSVGPHVGGGGGGGGGG